MAKLKFKYEPYKLTISEERAAVMAKYKRANGGFDPVKGTFSKFKTELYGGGKNPAILGEALDHLAHAARTGVFSVGDVWVTEAFATLDVFETFVNSLRDFESMYRISDFHWQALACLAQGIKSSWAAGFEEEGYANASDLADRLEELYVEFKE